MNIDTGEIREIPFSEKPKPNEVLLTEDQFEKLKTIPTQSRVDFWKQFNPKKAKRLGY